MASHSRIWRGITAIGALLLSLAMVAAVTLEMYRTSVDAALGTRSQRTVTQSTKNDKDTWNYQSSFKTAKEAYDGFKNFALKEGEETNVLLKNDNQALPLSKNAKITMFGVRSYAPVYGSSGGSIADGYSTVQITEAFKEKGFQINPSMLSAYESYFKGQKWTKPKFGSGLIPEYESITSYNNPHELSLNELKRLNPNYASEYKDYNDAAVVVVGRPAGENGDGYTPGQAGLADGVHTVTGNILSLSDEEMAIIHEAEANFKKVIVLVNSTNPMEIANLQDDANIDAIMWIGFPGAYGFYGVADTLNGTVNPSGALGDVFAKNSALAPAMANYGNIPWKNAHDFSEDAAVNSYLIQAEGIYTGYRYYETRYADIVSGRGGAQASAGTYAAADGTVATSDGTWDYNNEVTYPFGYGLSYTTFERKLNSVQVNGDKKSATASVTVTNTGKVAGKTPIQLYASAPYTQYDRDNGVEKSAIELIDFEKTDILQPGESQTIEMKVDLSVLASYDAKTAKTFIMDPGRYYFSLGDNVHEALNNVLSAQGIQPEMTDTVTNNQSSRTANSQSVVDDTVQQWDVDGDVDSVTFAVSKSGQKITNKLSEGDYATDFNAFQPGTVTYLSRSNWEGTYPHTYEGLEATGRLAELLGNDFIKLKKNEDTSDIKFGDKSSSLTINDMKGASYDDERWGELIDKVTLQEYLDFAANAFHAIGGMPSIGLPDMTSDDGPGGSDSHLLSEGQYQGTPYADGEKYNKATRVAPSPVNLAYTWNKELAYENGQILMGESTLVLNLPIMIGPAMNLHRHAYNSRGVEYYSEDPVLSGYTGSAVVQGAQSKGTLVNVKHLAFNDQEINRSGIAVFMNEQKARELELRNFQQAFEGNGQPASFSQDKNKDKRYGEGARGVMTSYNRIGAVAPSANRSVMVDILRDEWGFKGYNVTDFTSISLKAAPKESTLAGTVAFCGFGPQGIDYWTVEGLSGDRDMLLAIKQNLHYALYALANSAALNGVNSSTHTVNVMTSWRIGYIVALVVAGAMVLAGLAGYIISIMRARKGIIRGVKSHETSAGESIVEDHNDNSSVTSKERN
ncbi:beta-glucosidase [Alloscardovia theropitheci]|uniref:Beta-glucosidase n=1 Tax=Alloscardovia theropitheci TaxID=2496842 RepID=A0A4R0QNW2_9BIFI|nr:glycoside hydrolase family 3 C-terminal domain-containing protein [Alloscardovia theropitheci]TCD53874.1 beta-glucosidase [Alloscardovia theropitheci]